MRLLISQVEFEQLIGLQEPEGPVANFTMIYFTANWCSACRRLDLPAIEAAVGANWLKCDVDSNNYTAGYCGIRSIPTFLAIVDKKVVGSFGSSNTDDVIKWCKAIEEKAATKQI